MGAFSIWHWLIVSVLLIVCLPLYFLPSIVAWAIGSTQKSLVLVINVLLGWTLLGWFAALLIALLNRQSGTLKA